MTTDEQQLARFSISQFADNSSGWGPQGTIDTESKFENVPFAPFNKHDRLGRISDWSRSQSRRAAQQQAAKKQQQGGQQGAQQGDGGDANKGGNEADSMFHFKAEEDERSFSLVDTAKPKQPNKRKRRPQYRVRRYYNPHGRRNWRGRGRGRGGRGGRRNNYRRHWQSNEPKPPSIDPRPEWETIAELKYKSLVQEQAEPVAEPRDLLKAGSVHKYDARYEHITPQSEKQLQRLERRFDSPMLASDPIMRGLIAKAGTEASGNGNVFLTDVVLSTLMAATRSAASWDVVVRKRGDVLIFDQRPKSKIHMLTVNENWNETVNEPEGSINHPKQLMLEATMVNRDFAQQIMSDESISFESPSPFANARTAPGRPSTPFVVGYRYRSFQLEDGINVVARCEIDSYVQKKGSSEPQFVSVRALNELDDNLSGGIQYRRMFPDQPTSVIANEMKNNACKLARWVARAITADTKHIKLGFISRSHPQSARRHVIATTMTYKTPTLANQLRLTEAMLWGSFKAIVDTVRQQDGDGVFLIMKDPNKEAINLYRLPEADPVAQTVEASLG